MNQPAQEPAARHDIPIAEITGVVLAGGLGRRMSPDGQGVEKGMQRLHGKPLIQHAIDRLRPQVATLLINANRELACYRQLGWPVIQDGFPGLAGPLAGLECAMTAATTPWVVTVPCDSPLFPVDLIDRLSAGALQSGSRVAVASVSSQAQPVFLLAHRSLRENLLAFLASGRRRIDAWYAPLSPAIVEFADATAFSNINTLDELQAMAENPAAPPSPH